MLSFQEELLKSQLERLASPSRAAFAACCAERLATAYHAFAAQKGQVGQTGVFNDALAYVWDHILTQADSAATVRLLAAVMAAIPDENAPGWTFLTPIAEDALSAAAYALSCLQSGNVQEAAWAARRIYEALDYFVINRDNISPSEAGAELRILGDPLIQAEFARQARDVAALSAAGNVLSPDLVENIRARSVAEQAITFVS